MFLPLCIWSDLCLKVTTPLSTDVVLPKLKCSVNGLNGEHRLAVFKKVELLRLILLPTLHHDHCLRIIKGDSLISLRQWGLVHVRTVEDIDLCHCKELTQLKL